MIETKVVDLQNSVYDLKQVDLFIHQLSKMLPHADGKSAHEVSAPTHLGVTADAWTSGPTGHGDDTQHWSVGAESSPVRPRRRDYL